MGAPEKENGTEQTEWNERRKTRREDCRAREMKQ